MDEWNEATGHLRDEFTKQLIGINKRKAQAIAQLERLENKQVAESHQQELDELCTRTRKIIAELTEMGQTIVDGLRKLRALQESAEEMPEDERVELDLLMSEYK